MFLPMITTLRCTALTTALLITPMVVDAQTATPHPPRLEFRIPTGVFVATGPQRDHLKNAQMTAAQLTWLMSSHAAITGTFGWARSRDVALAAAPKLDVFTSDLGIETRSAETYAKGRFSMSGFAGVGAGVRSYNYRKLDVDATNNVAGYAALGGQFGIGRVGVRLEARNYVTAFKPLMGGGVSRARNDVTVMGALGGNRHRATTRKR